MLIRATQVSDAVFFNFKDKFLKVGAIHSPPPKKKQKSMKIFFETKNKNFLKKRSVRCASGDSSDE